MVEMLKNGGISIIDWLLKIFNKCMESGVVQEDRKAAYIFPVYKGKRVDHMISSKLARESVRFAE